MPEPVEEVRVKVRVKVRVRVRVMAAVTVPVPPTGIVAARVTPQSVAESFTVSTAVTAKGTFRVWVWVILRVMHACSTRTLVQYRS